MRKEAPTPRAEFLIAVAGPAVSFMLGAVCLGFVELTEPIQQQRGLRGLIILSTLLGAVNMQLGLFNLIPGFPLDGGRVLRAGLWAWGKDFYRATKQASIFGLGFGIVFVLLGFALLMGSVMGIAPVSMASNGSWIVLIGAFLFAAALASRRQAAIRQSLAAVPIRNLMVTTVVSIPSQCTIEEAVNQYFQPYGYGGFPVLEDGRLVGLITVHDIQSVSSAEWPWRHVGQLMRPVSPSLIVEPDTPVIDVMERMAREGWDRLVVMLDGHVVGLVTQSAILHFLQLRQASTR